MSYRCRVQFLIGVFAWTGFGPVMAEDVVVRPDGGLEVPRQDVLEMFAQGVPARETTVTTRPATDAAIVEASTLLPSTKLRESTQETTLPSPVGLDEPVEMPAENGSLGMSPAESATTERSETMWPEVREEAHAGRKAPDVVVVAVEDEDEQPIGGTSSRESEKGVIVAQRSDEPLWSLKDLAPLATVLALVGLSAWGLKRLMPGRKAATSMAGLEVVSQMALSPKQRLVLVKMGRQLLLLGVTGDQINTLSVVDDPHQVALLLGDAASSRPEAMTRAFADAFAEEAGAYDGTGQEYMEPDSEDEARGDVLRLLEKVRLMSSDRQVA